MVLKAFADRLQDWADIDSILSRQRGRLDQELVRRQLQPLVKLKEAPEILLRLDRMLAEGTGWPMAAGSTEEGASSAPRQGGQGKQAATRPIDHQPPHRPHRRRGGR